MEMLKTIREAWGIKELRSKMIFTLLMLVVYRIGSNIPVPGMNREVLAQVFAGDNMGLFELFNLFSGGSFANFTIFALSITPYITASIIIQLLTVAFPYFERLAKEGMEGRKKMAQITRYFTAVLAIIQESLHRQINKEHLEDLFSYSVSNQMNKLMRPVPLFLKNIAMRIVYSKSAVANTTTITNIGNIKIDELYQPYIEMFHSFIAMSKGQYLKGTICSYQDTLIFTFSSIFAEATVQKAFFRKIAEDGVEVSIETNGVYYE